VPSAEDFRSVADVLLDGVPADTDISSVGLGFPDGHWLVGVRTRTPGRVIGRRGATADALRAALAEELSDPQLKLDIAEAGRPGDPPAGSPPAGTREPRRPTPTAPADRLAIGTPPMVE
jgi:hypothetical protein